MKPSPAKLLTAYACALAALVAAESLPPDSAAEHSALNAHRARAKFYPADRFDLGALPAYKPEARVSGTIRLAGTNYIGDSGLADAWKEAFTKFHPDARFEFDLPTAAIAIPYLYADKADVAMNHEPHFYDHLAYVRMMGFAPTGVSVVTGSFNVSGWQNTMVIAVHRSNPLGKITMAELDGVFGSVRDGGWEGAVWRPELARGADKDIRTWGQLGLTGVWTGRRITPYGYTPRYATALEFSNRVLGASDKWSGDLRAFGNWRRPDGTIYGQAAQIMDHLKEDPAGIAIIRYVPDFPRDLKVLAIAPDARSPAVPYTIENLQTRACPLWGDQSFWFNRKPGEKLDPKVREFVRFVLSREGQALVQQDGKYLPLTAGIVREQLRKLE